MMKHEKSFYAFGKFSLSSRAPSLKALKIGRGEGVEFAEGVNTMID
jgi:hypothetical protein